MNLTSVQTQSQSSDSFLYPSPVDGIDEAYSANGDIHAHWQYLLQSLQSLGAEAIEDRQKKNSSYFA